MRLWLEKSRGISLEKWRSWKFKYNEGNRSYRRTNSWTNKRTWVCTSSWNVSKTRTRTWLTSDKSWCRISNRRIRPSTNRSRCVLNSKIQLTKSTACTSSFRTSTDGCSMTLKLKCKSWSGNQKSTLSKRKPVRSTSMSWSTSGKSWMKWARLMPMIRNILMCSY